MVFYKKKFNTPLILLPPHGYCHKPSLKIARVRRHFVPRHIVPGHILSRDNMSPGQYVALCPHYFAVQRGDILSQETYCPGSVRRHIVPGDVLSRLATNGNFGQQMHEGLLWLLWLLLLLILSMLSFGGFLAECLPCFNP